MNRKPFLVLGVSDFFEKHQRKNRLRAIIRRLQIHPKQTVIAAFDIDQPNKSNFWHPSNTPQVAGSFARYNRPTHPCWR